MLPNRRHLPSRQRLARLAIALATIAGFSAVATVVAHVGGGSPPGAGGGPGGSETGSGKLGKTTAGRP